MVRAIGYREKMETLGGVPVRITTYEIGEKFFCKIDNLDPGGVIARAWGPDRLKPAFYAPTPLANSTVTSDSPQLRLDWISA